MIADRYRVQERLGHGGMADVHAAYDELLDRRVAVKVLRDSPDSEVARRRFLQEARLLAGLSHPGLVKVLDAGFSGERPFLVMELLPGGTLADLVDRGARPADEVAHLGAQVAAALAEVHAAGVVHRDVKPSNVLLDAEGHARLADFGIARLTGDTVRNTMTGMTIGTMTYLAPEQATGGEVTGAADVYSLGLVLLELLTGVAAFTGTATEAALARLSNDPRIPTGLPVAFRELLADMTARSPEQRPSALQASEALSAVATDSASRRAAQVDVMTQALPAYVEQPARERATRRTPILVAVGALAVAAVVALGVGLTPGGAPAGPASASPQTTAASSRSAEPSAAASSGAPVVVADDRSAAASPSASPTQRASAPSPARSVGHGHRKDKAKHHKAPGPGHPGKAHAPKGPHGPK